MFTSYNTDIYKYDEEIFGLRLKTKPFQKQLLKNEYSLWQVKIYAIQNSYPIIVLPFRSKYWYIKGYGCTHSTLKNIIDTNVTNKYREKSTLYFINESY